MRKYDCVDGKLLLIDSRHGGRLVAFTQPGASALGRELVNAANATSELVEAARAWVNHLESPDDGAYVTFEDEKKLLDNLKAAIAKAEVAHA